MHLLLFVKLYFDLAKQMLSRKVCGVSNFVALTLIIQRYFGSENIFEVLSLEKSRLIAEYKFEDFRCLPSAWCNNSDLIQLISITFWLSIKNRFVLKCWFCVSKDFYFMI